MKTISPTIKVIKAEMERQKIGVHELADAVGMAASTLYRLLEGDSDPQLSTVEDLEKALKITYKRVKK